MTQEMKTSKIEIRITDAEKEIVRRAAKAAGGLTISEYIRDVVVKASNILGSVSEGQVSKQLYVDYEMLRADAMAETASTGEPYDEKILDQAYESIFNREP